MAIAFVLDQLAQSYLEQFPAFPGIASSFAANAIQQFPIDPQHTLKELLQGIIDAQGQQDVLVDTHGVPGSYANMSLQMKVHGRSQRHCNKDSLSVLMAFHELDAQIAAAGSNLGNLPSFIQQQRSSLAYLINQWDENADDYPSEPQGHIDRWQGDLASYLFQSAGNPQQRLVWTREVTSRIDRVRARNIALHFTSCNLGADRIVLQYFFRFFGARSVSGLDVRSFFAGPLLRPASRNVASGAVQHLAAQSDVATFGNEPDRVLVRTVYQGNTPRVRMVADSFAAVATWTRTHLSAESTYSTGDIYLHFLQTDPPAYPLDQNYRSHVITVQPAASAVP